MSYGKHFASMYTGSMYGAGPTVFAVWGYVIANAIDSQVELNARALADMIGTTVPDIESAIAYLTRPDADSRSKEEDGRRLLHEGAFAYRVVTHEKYRSFATDAERRAYERERKRDYRAKNKDVPPDVPDDSRTVADIRASASGSESGSVLGKGSAEGKGSGVPSADPGVPIPEADLPVPLRLTRAANQAIAARYGESTKPLVWSSTGAALLASELADASVPSDFACGVIVSVIQARKDDRPPHSMTYFRAAILDRWQEQEARRDAASSPRIPALPSQTQVLATTGDAALLLTKIKGLTVTHQTPGMGAKQIIPKAKVAELGPDVLQAYEAVGGASAVLTTDGKWWSKLVRDFGDALAAARRATVSV